MDSEKSHTSPFHSLASLEEEPFLPTESVGQFQRNQYPVLRQLRCFICTTIGLLVVAITMIAVFGTTTIFYKSESLNTGILISPCGSSPGEARAAGCTFDIMSFCWLPARCYDAPLSASFAARSNWTWSLDREYEKPVTEEAALSGDHGDLWVNIEYHLLHCAYMWRKFHRAIMGPEGKRAVDSYIANYTHTKHCEHMFMSNREKGLAHVNTIIQVKYPDCGMR